MIRYLIDNIQQFLFPKTNASKFHMSKCNIIASCQLPSKRKDIVNRNTFHLVKKLLSHHKHLNQMVPWTEHTPTPTRYKWSVDVNIYNRCKVFCKEVKLMTHAAHNPKWILSSDDGKQLIASKWLACMQLAVGINVPADVL